MKKHNRSASKPKAEIEVVVPDEVIAKKEDLFKPIKMTLNNCLTLNIRSEPSVKSTILTFVGIGTILDADSAEGNWMHISAINGVEVDAYAMAVFLKEI